MKRVVFGIALLLGLTLSTARSSPSALDSLRPEGYVTDPVGLLPPAEKAALEQRLAFLEAQTGTQMAIVIIDSLEGEPIEGATERLFRTWGIGQKKKDNGLLLLVALRDRAMRIEVGYGLEGVIPDAVAGDIIRQQLAPAFRSGQYAKGFEAAIDTVSARLVNPAEAREAPEKPRWTRRFSLEEALPVVIVLAFTLPATVVGGLLATGGWWLLGGWRFGFLIFPLLGLFVDLARWRRSGISGSAWGNGGWGPGGWGGSGGFGGGFGGFGGGSSGGGGASGRW